MSPSTIKLPSWVYLFDTTTPLDRSTPSILLPMGFGNHLFWKNLCYNSNTKIVTRPIAELKEFTDVEDKWAVFTEENAVLVLMSKEQYDVEFVPKCLERH